MKIIVRIRVRKATEDTKYLGYWSVEYGPDAFTYCGTYTTDSYESLRAELDRIADLLTTDPRMRAWPGVQVSAENLAARNPNGWDANRKSREVRRNFTRVHVPA